MTSRLACAKRPLSGVEDLELARGLPIGSLSLLLRGALYAQNAHRPTWDFALELDQLRAAGLSESDLRWLAFKGYIEHGLETSRVDSEERTFDEASVVRFTDRSWFVLTPRGMVLAKSLLASDMEVRTELQESRAAVVQDVAGCVLPIPSWDRQRRELRLGRIVVKQYRVPAENQELVLTAFEEEAWPVRIDDPLPSAPQIDRKRRLHATIQCLNRNRKAHVLQFHGDGCGNGVRWELLLVVGDAAADDRGVFGA